MRSAAALLTLLICLQTVSAKDGKADSVADAELRSAVHLRSAQVLLEELTAKKQAELKAGHESGYGFELRPRVNEDQAGAALRVYLPDYWNRQALSEQLALAARSEELRVSALEWQDLMAAYRSFCDYRLLNRQQGLLQAELRFLEPYLGQADAAVKQHQLAVVERAKFYSQQLDLMNQLDNVALERLETEQALALILGRDADLKAFSRVARLPGPANLNADALVHKALMQRSDYRRYEVDVQALQSAEAAAESEKRFHLKYIQPSYDLDYLGGGNSWGLSASFVLPWGMRNASVPVYRQQRAWLTAAQEQQRKLISEKIHVLVHTARTRTEQLEQRLARTGRLVEQLQADLDDMKGGTLEQVRDRLAIRNRLLDTEWQTAEAEYKMECLAVDLARALGRLQD